MSHLQFHCTVRVSLQQIIQNYEKINSRKSSEHYDQNIIEISTAKTKKAQTGSLFILPTMKCNHTVCVQVKVDFLTKTIIQVSLWTFPALMT